MRAEREQIKYRCYPPSYVASRFPPEAKVTVDRVRGWIRDGRLEALNLGTKLRPMWFVTDAALDAFMSTSNV